MKGRCIAMWSGPRNISTAMMRAWENRPDTTVIDEPFYAHFLSHTRLDHPMRDEIIDSGVTDWRKVVDHISQTPEKGILYQKHISTHWLEHFSTDWLDKLDHVFLIRKPEPVVASYAVKRVGLTPGDLGYSQQAALFELISKRQGRRPMVVDSQRFLGDPELQLKQICEGLEIAFDDRMLSWPNGARQSDGVWGAHWYDAVNQSTGFVPPRSKTVALDEQQRRVAAICTPYYQSMQQFAI